MLCLQESKRAGIKQSHHASWVGNVMLNDTRITCALFHIKQHHHLCLTFEALYNLCLTSVSFKCEVVTAYFCVSVHVIASAFSLVVPYAWSLSWWALLFDCKVSWLCFLEWKFCSREWEFHIKSSAAKVSQHFFASSVSEISWQQMLVCT